MRVYRTKANVQIGLAYQDPRRPYHDADALRLQAALINKCNRQNGIEWLVISVCLASAIAAWVLA